MGQDVERRQFSRADRMAYREKIRSNLDALTRMLAESEFAADRPLTGL